MFFLLKCTPHSTSLLLETAALHPKFFLFTALNTHVISKNVWSSGAISRKATKILLGNDNVGSEKNLGVESVHKSPAPQYYWPVEAIRLGQRLHLFSSLVKENEIGL